MTWCLESDFSVRLSSAPSRWRLVCGVLNVLALDIAAPPSEYVRPYDGPLMIIPLPEDGKKVIDHEIAHCNGWKNQ